MTNSYRRVLVVSTAQQLRLKISRVYFVTHINDAFYIIMSISFSAETKGRLVVLHLSTPLHTHTNRKWLSAEAEVYFAFTVHFQNNGEGLSGGHLKGVIECFNPFSLQPKT